MRYLRMKLGCDLRKDFEWQTVVICALLLSARMRHFDSAIAAEAE